MTSIVKLIALQVALCFSAVLVRENDTIMSYVDQKQDVICKNLMGPAYPDRFNPKLRPMRTGALIKKLEASLKTYPPGHPNILYLKRRINVLKRDNFMAHLSNRIC